ncbi:MAG TPA: zinc ribbon domain-containing protein, partial [Acidimicrobiales bacterium]|nr:zinc ribbon domain-containing protein [Acidimicrobiales bacterium]
MNCPSCGTEVPPGASACPSCGTAISAGGTGSVSGAAPAAATSSGGGSSFPGGTSGVPGAPPAAGPAGGGTAGGGTAGGGTAGGATMPQIKLEMSKLDSNDRLVGVSAILLFIALFLPWFDVSTRYYTFTGDAMDSHGFMWLVLVVTILLVAYLGWRVTMGELPFKLPLPHKQVLLLATAFDALLVVICFIWRPASGVGWDWGS